jgi:hypothetical protein
MPPTNVREEWSGFPARRMADGCFPPSVKPRLGSELSEASLATFLADW